MLRGRKIKEYFILSHFPPAGPRNRGSRVDKAKSFAEAANTPGVYSKPFVDVKKVANVNRSAYAILAVDAE